MGGCGVCDCDCGVTAQRSGVASDVTRHVGSHRRSATVACSSSTRDVAALSRFCSCLATQRMQWRPDASSRARKTATGYIQAENVEWLDKGMTHHIDDRRQHGIRQSPINSTPLRVSGSQSTACCFASRALQLLQRARKLRSLRLSRISHDTHTPTTGSKQWPPPTEDARSACRYHRLTSSVDSAAAARRSIAALSARALSSAARASVAASSDLRCCARAASRSPRTCSSAACAACFASRSS